MRKTQSQKTSAALNQILKASSIVFIGVVLSKVLGYVYRIIVARYYGPEIYGLFLLSLMIVTLFATVAEIGLSEGLLRFISFYRGKKNKEKIAAIFQGTIKIVSITGIFAAIALFFFSEYIAEQIFHNPDLTLYLKIFCIVIPISLWTNLYLSTIRSFEEIGWHSFIYNIFQNVVKIAVLAMLIFLGFTGRDSVLISFIVGIFSMLVVSYWFLKYKLPSIFHKVSKKDKGALKEVLAYSMPMMLSSVVSTFLFWIDSFLIGVYYPGTDGAYLIGIYNVAAPLASLLLVAPELLLQLFLPLINKEFANKNNKTIQGVSKQLSKWVSIVNLPLLVVILLFPGVLINLLFGPEYLPAENSLRILAIGIYLLSLSGIFRGLITMDGKSKFIFYISLGAGLLNTVLNMILIPPYGIVGAATATAICYSLLTLVLLLESKRLLGFWALKREIIKVLLVSLIPTTIVLIGKELVTVNIWSIAALGIIFVISYALVIMLTKCFDDEDKRVINTIINKIKPLGHTKNLSAKTIPKR